MSTHTTHREGRRRERKRRACHANKNTLIVSWLNEWMNEWMKVCMYVCAIDFINKLKDTVVASIYGRCDVLLFHRQSQTVYTSIYIT